MNRTSVRPYAVNRANQRQCSLFMVLSVGLCRYRPHSVDLEWSCYPIADIVCQIELRQLQVKR